MATIVRCGGIVAFCPFCTSQPLWYCSACGRRRAEVSQTVCVDLDGVLNLYEGWRGKEFLDPPRPGARQFMTALGERYRVVILTTRDPAAVWSWLDAHHIPADEVTSMKPPAVVYIDDRAICFRGAFDGLLEQIAGFRVHWEPAPVGGK